MLYIFLHCLNQYLRNDIRSYFFQRYYLFFLLFQDSLIQVESLIYIFIVIGYQKFAICNLRINIRLQPLHYPLYSNVEYFHCPVHKMHCKLPVEDTDPCRPSGISACLFNHKREIMYCKKIKSNQHSLQGVNTLQRIACL